MSSGRLRVVEDTQGLAGPVCGRLFAGLGHDVIKCEPPDGDPLRRQSPLDDQGVGWQFRAVNAGKRSIVVDDAARLDGGLMNRLLRTADVLITDGPVQEHRQAQTQLVITSITGVGLHRNESAQCGDSLLAEAYGGLATMIGEPDQRPLALGGDQAAYAAGFAGFLGTMIALANRNRTGAGDVVDVAMCDVAAYMDWKSDIAYAATGKVVRRRGTKSGRWRLVRAADGWIGVIYQPEQWPLVRRLIDDARLQDPRLDSEQGRDELANHWWPAIEEWAQGRSKRAAYDQAQALGLPFGYVATLTDVCQSAQLAYRGFFSDDNPSASAPVGPFFKSTRALWTERRTPRLDGHRATVTDDLRRRGTAGTPRPTACLANDAGQTAGSAPLDGYTVIDLGTITAGAAAARLLADYGATVIKIESPSRPDPFRRWNPPGGGASTGSDACGTSPLFESNNVGKYSVALDLKSERGRAEFADLVRAADVIVENFRVGVTERLGIGFESLRSLNPNLVYLSLSSHGQTGPDAAHASFGSTLDLVSGLASLTGYAADDAIWSSDQVNYPDQLVSLAGAGLVAYCLQQEQRDVHLDVAQAEVLCWTLADALGDRRTNQQSQGSGTAVARGTIPRDTYPVSGADQWVAIVCVSDEQRARLAELTGLNVSSYDERWWAQHRPHVDRGITAWTTERSRRSCVARLRAAGIPTAPVLDAAERAADVSFTGRRVFLEEPVRLKGYPFLIGAFTPEPAWRARPLGTDTTDVLASIRSRCAGTPLDAARKAPSWARPKRAWAAARGDRQSTSSADLTIDGL